ncbi:MAG: hypothetical protein G8345_09670 [Magnetococcales bacterium]|nr:hypothetical protein [Magnetococcales bacterium]NGZ27139.1 hypothetical protein [Magnetococcales bacterium]
MASLELDDLAEFMEGSFVPDASLPTGCFSCACDWGIDVFTSWWNINVTQEREACWQVTRDSTAFLE